MKLKMAIILGDKINNSVLSIDSAVKLLKSENVDDLCCIEIPEYLNYANYLLIGTTKSVKHMHTACENFNKHYKMFKEVEDAFAKSLGKKSEKWCAIDCGNIVIHLFQREYRDQYDLESLWSVGCEHDEKYIEIITKQNEIISKMNSLEVK